MSFYFAGKSNIAGGLASLTYRREEETVARSKLHILNLPFFTQITAAGHFSSSLVDQSKDASLREYLSSYRSKDGRVQGQISIGSDCCSFHWDCSCCYI
ncbi:hypothetical protein L6452_24331 [Arctium lappa]|uniref:Uncharacterized protein n=1 Tax=Arctium lappa TaxID=4217 RepID=A0ACB9A9K8_ARCLA|nr:hypothetical protein L6452_24331 [Arctium lappa]